MIAILKCPKKHMWLDTLTRNPAMSGWRSTWLPAEVTCPTCGTRSSPNKIVSFEKATPAVNYGVRKFTPSTFAGEYTVARAMQRGYKSDKVLSILASHGFVWDSSIERFRTAANEYAIFYGVRRSRKTTDMYLVAALDNPVFKEIETALREENKAKRAVAKGKPKTTIPESMPDIIGQELVVGDWVSYIRYGYLAVGQIVRFSLKSVTIMPHKSRSPNSGIFSEKCTKLNNEAVILWRLKQ